MSIPAEFTRFPSHWEVLPFTQAVQDATSGNVKIQKADYSETGEFPIVDQGQSLFGGYTDDSSSVCNSELPTIVFGDHTRAFKYLETRFALGADGAKVLEPKANLDKRFLFHYLKQLRIESAGYSRHYKFLKETYVPVPPLNEQIRIAAILDKADAIRRKRQQAIQLADEFLRAVFLDMFGDPVTNSKGWEVKSLSMLTSKITDGTHKTPTYTNKGIPFLSAKNIKDYGLDWTDTKYISQEEHGELVKRCNPEVGDILLSKSGSLGTPAIVDVDKDFSLFESAALLKPLGDKIKPKFLLHFLRSKPGKHLMLKSTKGVAIKHLHLTDLRDLPVIVPPMDLQESFSNTVEKMVSLESKNLTSADSKEVLFKSLGQKAFAGEL